MIESDLKSNGVAVTIAENLNCRYILHLDAETQKETWEEKITKCLLTIENSNVGQSMAFPTLGQGMGMGENLKNSQYLNKYTY